MTTLNRYLGGLVVPLILLLSACSQRAPFETGAVDSSSVQIVTSAPASSEATCTFSEEPILVIGDDEEDDNQWFSLIRGTGRLSDGSVVAVDRASAEVRIYDASGRHLRSMGQRGEGPGEFTNPFILWVTAGDTLWVGDYRPWRYTVFTAQGEFVRRIVLKPVYPNLSRAGGVLENGYTVNTREKLMRSPDFSVTDTMIVEIHDPDGELVGSLARIPHRTLGKVSEASENFWMHPLFDTAAEVDALGSTIVLAHGSKSEVQVLDDEFNLRMIIRWLEPDRKVTRADVRAWREDYRERNSQPSFLDWNRNNDPMISPERPVADVFPVMSSVRIGRDGRIWIRQYDRPREDRGWLAFSADGKFACHMAQPPGDVWEFGADYVLLVHQPELGVQTVRMHRASRHLLSLRMKDSRRGLSLVESILRDSSLVDHWHLSMRQNREVVRRINGRGREYILFCHSPVNLTCATPTMSANERQTVYSALEFRARFHGFKRVVATIFRRSVARATPTLTEQSGYIYFTASDSNKKHAVKGNSEVKT